MKYLIYFVSVTAMYIGLSEALPPVKDCNYRMIEIQNKLGSGQILKYQCSSVVGPEPIRGLLKFNEKYVFKYSRVYSKTWICNFDKRTHGYELVVELSAPKPPCNSGLRTWIVKSDGIYFERDGKKPMKLVGRWSKNVP
ncbi:unnamed protein product [Brassica rapa subsp. trilocularis]|uniref:(rape) hypothetical protein n=1 Tax=Brassica napus TaxID=3708 RepID=A0A817A6D8_BRANA|nr:unnamed protein product [Brassica napus]